MSEYIFQGSLSLTNVDFFITADDEDAARSKAKAGEYDNWETSGAASSNWMIDSDTLELNE
ncbi:MAG: hypothetical protein J3T61_00020 [Candidatus Brocadiales bacterium]|nr:hypothetical protein [Candidatus Bathyanammoxibius sp.]